MTHAEQCPVCGGCGTILGRHCHGCDGKGWVLAREETKCEHRYCFRWGPVGGVCFACLRPWDEVQAEKREKWVDDCIANTNELLDRLRARKLIARNDEEQFCEDVREFVADVEEQEEYVEGNSSDKWSHSKSKVKEHLGDDKVVEEKPDLREAAGERGKVVADFMQIFRVLRAAGQVRDTYNSMVGSNAPSGGVEAHRHAMDALTEALKEFME